MAASHSVAGLQARAQAVVEAVVVNGGVSMRPPGKLYVSAHRSGHAGIFSIGTVRRCTEWSKGL